MMMDDDGGHDGGVAVYHLFQALFHSRQMSHLSLLREPSYDAQMIESPRLIFYKLMWSYTVLMRTLLGCTLELLPYGGVSWG